MKLKLVYSITISVCLTLLCRQAFAQKDTLLKSSVIDVLKTFKPILSEAIKIPVNPNPEVPEAEKPSFFYKTIESHFNDVPTLYIIKPLSLGAATLAKIKNNYTRLGYGNYKTPLAEFYLNTGRNTNWNSGLFLKHLSSGGDNEFNNYSYNNASAFVKRFTDAGMFGADFYYTRNLVNLYGFDDNPVPSKSDAQLIYQAIDLAANYDKIAANDKFGFKAVTSFYNYTSNKNIQENNFLAKTSINFSHEGIPFEIKSSLMINNTSYSDSSVNSTYFTLNPRLSLKDKAFYVNAGFNSTFFVRQGGNKLYFFPDVEAAYHILPEKLDVYMGITGNLKINTFRKLTFENPFVMMPKLVNTVNKFEIYAGLKGKLSSKTSFMLISSSSNIDNLLMFTWDLATNSQNTIFDVGKVTITKLGAEINHQVSEKFKAALGANLYGYSMGTISKPYSLPTFETFVKLKYNMGDKFLIDAEILYLNERDARKEFLNNYEDRMLNPFTDLNLGIDYRYNKNVSAFINVNNIANNRYQRWLNYPVFGINILGGLTLMF